MGMPQNAAAIARTLVELLQQRAERYRDRSALEFSKDGGLHHNSRLTYRELHTAALQIASHLQRQGARGQRVLVLCPPGLDFIAGLFGCLYAGAIAVPVHPPMRDHLVPRVASIIADLRPGAALTTADVHAKIVATIDDLAEERSLHWCVVDAIADDEPQWLAPDIDADTVAMVQYTSGSTSAPKGVVLTHGNLLHNLGAIRQAWDGDDHAIGVFWLPPFHDMGLIGGIFETLYVGGTSMLMPPTSFIKHPMRWLEAISRHRATITAAPNFAYDMCVEVSSPEQRAALDLSRWSTALCGAEPVGTATLQRFADAFAPAGFRPEALRPVYGLAEGTLLVSGGSDSVVPVVKHLDRTAFGDNRVVATTPDDPTAAALVGCGRPRGDQRVVIVDPETRRACRPDEIGEIWVSGPSVAQGYWANPADTEETFSASLADTGEGPFLRTGDLGFLQAGELFVTGRCKDLIIIRGTNHYPNDIELTVQDCHPALLPGRGAVFATTPDPGGAEQLVVTQEVDPTRVGAAELAEIVRTIRAAVTERHTVRVDAVVLTQPLQLPTTTSGKIQRGTCRQQFRDGELAVVTASHTASHTASSPEPQAVTAGSPTAESPPGGHSATQIAEWLISQLAGELELPAVEIDPSRPFAYYGLDSVHAVRLTTALEAWLGHQLPPTVAYDYPTIDLLSDHLARLGNQPASETPGAERAAGPDERSRPADEPIAVIGIGCRFPGAGDPAAFWRLLTDGIDAVGEIPPDRWDADAFYNPDPSVPGTAVTRRGGFLRGVDQFDFSFFDISPRESAQMDPQQRLLLETAWEALEDGGQVPERLAGSRTGVFAGLSTNDYGHLPLNHPRLVDAYTGTGNALSIAANRLSYVFDFHGPSMTVDTACSSSLVAVDLACRSLRDGECTLALAAGANVILSPALTVNFTKAQVLAPDGRCKTFDAGADGYVRGEGAGTVVLKPLSTALADNDPIYAVIRGTATNSDGRTNGLIAPSGRSQQAVLTEAYRRAGLSPGAVGYVEAHGTGTALGDAIEANALGAVLADGRPPESRCLVGSVKTNIGHLEAAAGIAGLIKVVLALQHRVIPQSLHFTEPNPHIPFGELPLDVAQSHTTWPDHGGRAVAGVSSFGFGGTNAHVVLAEAPHVRIATGPPDADRAELLPLSARSPEALDALVGEYEKALVTGATLTDLCYTAGARRSHHEHRLCLVGEARAAMLDSLAAYRRGESRPGLSVGQCRPGRRPLVTFLFSGHGSQWYGMGQRLQADEPVFRDALAACDRALSPHLGCSVLAELAAGQDHSRLADIGVVQPAIFAVQVALAALWRSWGVEPAAVVGHSMGEVAGAHVAGALSLDDAARVICARARLLRRVRGPGTMAVVEATTEEARELIAGREGQVAIAATNSCRTTVLSGESTALADLMVVLEHRDRFCRLIDVDVASHSPQVGALGADLRETLAGIEPTAPTIPIYSAVTGDLLGNRLLDADYWVDNLCSPVRFSPALRRLLDDGQDAFVEISPHPILLTAAREDAEDLGRECTLVPSLRRDDDGRATALASLAILYTQGQPVTWDQLSPFGGRCITAPTYPWQRRRSWLDAAIPSPATGTHQSTDTETHTPWSLLTSGTVDAGQPADGLRDRAYRLRWGPASIRPHRDALSRSPETGSWLIFSDGATTTDTLRDHLESHSQACVVVEPGPDYRRLAPDSYRLDPRRPEHFRRLLTDAFGSDRPACRGVVHLWSLLAAPPPETSAESLESATDTGPLSVLHLVQALSLADWPASPRLWLVTRAAQVIDADDRSVSIAQAPVWGLGRSIDQEHPELRCTRVDLSADGGTDELRTLFEEIRADDPEADVALRGCRRYAARLIRSDDTDRVESGGTERLIRPADATYLVTGGLGALGLKVATGLVGQGARHLVLMGRSAPSEFAKAVVDALRASGSQADVVCGDVTRAGDVAAVLESVDASMPPLRGVVHAAGVVDDAILQSLDARQLREAMAPKVQGAWNLHTLTSDAELDFFVLFSSAASVLGSAGAANYGAANAFLDALAWQRHGEGRPALSINWGPWAGLGFSTRSGLHRRLSQHGVKAMPPADCLRALWTLLWQSAPQVAIFDVDWKRWCADNRPTLLAELRIASEPEPVDGADGPGRGLFAALYGAIPQQRQRILESYLRDLTAGKLGLAPSTLDTQAPLNGLGVDSLITLELRLQIERDLGLVVPTARLLNGPSVADLSGWLAEQVTENLAEQVTENDAASPSTPPTAGVLAENMHAHDASTADEAFGIGLLTQVPNLSDDAVDELLHRVIADDEFADNEGNNDR